MDAGRVPALSYRRSKPRGKVRRRVQDLRVPSSSRHDVAAGRPALDLSHNESARLAADSLLSRGLEGYHEVLDAEGEVDFLSGLEKNYFLENGSDANTDDPGASHDGDKELENVCGPQSDTPSPAVSTDSESTVTGLDLGSLEDMMRTDPVLDEPNIEVYFQADSRAAGMKDLIRKFIRKAGMALAIVMDSFSDVELLCDLLEASRKRNVSVHLLLDHFNLNLFLSMWQDLKLDSKSFPKLSVHSVDGQTYCAKTGRKLTGQIAENFIITDWTEVLTGSFSFSWLTWRVHRSLAVLVKGGTVRQFHREFLRLHASSKPVPGFVDFITVPHTLPLRTTLDASQNAEIDASKSKLSPTKTTSHGAGKEDAQNTQANAKMSVLSNPDEQTLHRAGAGTPMQEKPPQLYLKPLVQPEAQQIVSVDNQTQIQSRSNPLSQTPVSYVQSQLTSLAITIAENNVRAQEPITVHTASPTHKQHRIASYQSTFKGNLERHNVDTEGLLFRQGNRTRPMEPSATAAGRDAQSRHRNYSHKIKPKFLPPSMSQQKQAKTGLRFPLTPQKGHTSGPQTKVSSLGTRRQDQPALPAHPTAEAPGSKSASSAMGAHRQPQLQTDSKLFLPGALHLQPHTAHQARPPPGLNWMPQSRTERPRPVTRHSSFDATYGTGQKTDGREGWRPFQSGMNTLLGRSKNTNPNKTET